MKSKTIFSISMAKNEMDIIESFVRYNSNILDGMIILDNGSTDDTLKILKQLQKEGLLIIILEDEDREFNQAFKMNKLLIKAVEEFNADIIVPLDADEFLISTTGENPRHILEKIEPHSFYHVPWKTYVPNFGQNELKKFMPSKITFVRENAEEMNKVILTGELVKDFSAELSKGNHRLVYKKKYENDIKQILNSGIQVAHFPIRSKTQGMLKISIGWLNTVCDVNRTKYQSWHRQQMFNELKRTGNLENEDIATLAKIYSTTTKLEKITTKEDPMDLSFCKNIEIKYTPDTINFLPDLLETCERISLDYLNCKKEYIEEKKRLAEKVHKLNSRVIKMKYLNNEGRSKAQILVSKFPSIYILLNSKKTGFNTALIYIKGYRAIKKNNLLDIGYYLRRYYTVRKSGVDPIMHYLYHGFSEGKKPSYSFDGEYYIKKYDDVKKSKLNPLVHYSLYGIKKGRKTTHAKKGL
ncbi:MAG: glycosyltransferase family 2 protein [Methanobacteriaceae archaeon]|nr:glycosyltransferase family 2 protein [Methanobacteriaceae archaeon]